MSLFNKSGLIFVFSIIMILSACGGNSGEEILVGEKAIDRIAEYARNPQSAPTIQDYIEAGVNGVDATKIDKLNIKVASLNYEDVDTKEEIQAILDELEITITDTTKPVILLKGHTPLNIIKGSTYVEAGAIGVDDRDGVLDVVISGEVDTNISGAYAITYTAKDNAGNTNSLIRIVNIQDGLSCMQVITHAYNPETGEEKDFPTPCDVPRGWIAGTPPDTSPPVITLLGGSEVNLALNQIYADAGATASDNTDGDITNNIVVVNPVVTDIEGTYQITYNIDDAAGNHATQITRTVVVSSLPARVYGEKGSSEPADPIEESVNGMSTIIMPEGVSSANPVPVIFLAPGFKGKDYTKYQALLNFIASHGYAVIFAKDDEGFSANHLINYMKEMVNSPAIKPLLDTSKMGIIGHSSGGGHAFRILKEFSELSDGEGIKWGENGRFLLALEPWFSFDMTEDDMKALPSNSNIVIQQYGIGGNNRINDTDPRIPLTEYSLLESIADDKKDYQVYVDADHGYPYKTSYSEMQGLLKPLDALMEFTFKASPQTNAQQVALEIGNDDPYGSGLQVVNDSYGFGCDGANTIIDYCAIVARKYPSETSFTSIATNRSQDKPVLRGSVTDPEFGTTVTRITDRANENGNELLYPKTPSWNSDMSLLRLRYRLYNADTLVESPITKDAGNNSSLYNLNGSLGEMKWSNTEPNVYYGMSSRYAFVKATINQNQISTEDLVTFASAEYDAFTLGKFEGNIDHNDRYVVFAARKKGKSYLTAIVFDIHTETVIVSKDFTDIDWVDADGKQILDWVSVSPSGNSVLINWKDKPQNPNGSAQSSIHQYDINLNYVRKLADQGQHGDIGVDKDGADVWVQFEFGGADAQGIWSYRLTDGQRARLLPSKYNGGHVSCRNTKRPGWCYLSTTQEGYREVFAVKLDGSEKVNRFVQTRTSDAKNSFGGVSPDGTRIIFDSDWGVDGDVRDTYHVK